MEQRLYNARAQARLMQLNLNDIFTGLFHTQNPRGIEVGYKKLLKSFHGEREGEESPLRGSTSLFTFTFGVSMIAGCQW